LVGRIGGREVGRESGTFWKEAYMRREIGVAGNMGVNRKARATVVLEY